MFFVIVFLVVGVVIGLCILVNFVMGGYDFADAVLGGIVGLVLMYFIAAALGAIGFAIAAGIGHATSPEYEVTHEIRLVALKDTESTEGRFFLGSGHIGSDLFYNYLYETKNGGIRAGWLRASDGILYEQDRKDALIKVWERDNIRPFGIEFSEPQYEIFIPKGSILRLYEIDLE